MKRRSCLAALLTLSAMPLLGAQSDCGAQTSDSVSQDSIHAGYWLYYNANTDKTSARVQLRFGGPLGTPLELKPPGQVTFEGKTLGWNPLLTWHESELAGKVRSGSYLYTDTRGATLTNRLEILREIDLPASFPATLPRSQAYTLTWIGDPIQSGEDLEVVFANKANPLLFIRFDQINQGSTDLVLGADQLAKLPPGATSVALRRHHNGVPSAVTSAGGKTQVTYEAKERIVTLQ